MHISSLLAGRFLSALKECEFAGQVQDLSRYAEMIRPAGNPKFGDYQSNCAMPIGKLVSGLNPRSVAEQVIAKLDIDDLCEPPEIAGPGFINLSLKREFIESALHRMLGDDRCLVEKADSPKKILIDYSSPNVAKPMHVGHIRTTVIGHCLASTLKFLGHEVVTDNHLGDWGTQFGMIIYGYKHFGDPDVVAKDPVPELAKLYRTVHQLIGYHDSVASVSRLDKEIVQLQQQCEEADSEADAVEGKEAKKKKKQASSLRKKLDATLASLDSAKSKIAEIDGDPVLKQRANEHPTIGVDVLTETSKLHAGDEENLSLWKQFLPHCKDEINRVYSRLNVEFDYTLGESFYHPMLGNVVDDLRQRGLATESDGAVCVFMDQFDSPMIIRKRDGAFLYATTDIATLQYRQTEFSPDEILYVVDARQSEHFEKLFAVADQIGLCDAKLVHVSFGTVLGEDGRPMKTRSGSLIGLESLLDDAVSAARAVVCDPERLAGFDPPMSDDEVQSIAERVGIGAIKYADLSHDRTSDYKFNLSKMVALSGNTSTYAQYSYARTRGILRKGDMSDEQVIALVEKTGMALDHQAERDLALALLRFEEALLGVRDDYRPNLLVDYVYSTAETFSRFNQQCKVLAAENELSKSTRLALVILTGRVIRKSLSLLGIETVDRM